MRGNLVNSKILVLPGLFIILMTGIGISQEVPALVDEMGYADTILVNGKIATMDDRSIVPNTPGNIVQAMAIKGKKIMALGSNAEMQALAGSKTRTIDLDQKTVIPGLIQTHYHLFSSAAELTGLSMG